MHSIPMLAYTLYAHTQLSRGERILSWCYMSWKLFEWVINIYGWAWVIFCIFIICIFRKGEPKRNKTISFVCNWQGPSKWYGAYVWRAQRVRLIQQAPLIHEPPYRPDPRRKRWTLLRKSETLASRRRPALNFSTQCECFDTPLSLSKHQHQPQPHPPSSVLYAPYQSIWRKAFGHAIASGTYIP